MFARQENHAQNSTHPNREPITYFPPPEIIAKLRMLEKGPAFLHAVREARKLRRNGKTGAVAIDSEPGSGKSLGAVSYLALNLPESDIAYFVMSEPRKEAVRNVNQGIEDVFYQLKGQVGVQYRGRNTAENKRIRIKTPKVIEHELRNHAYRGKKIMLIFDEIHEGADYENMGYAYDQNIPFIVMSGTYDPNVYRQLYSASIIEAEGKKPRQVIKEFTPDAPFDLDNKDNLEWVRNAAVERALALNQKYERNERTGNALIIMPGQKDTDIVAQGLINQGIAGDKIVILHAGLPEAERKRISEIENEKGIFLITTPLTESSMNFATMPIENVIDSTLIYQDVYNPELGIMEMVLTKQAESGLIQRANRAGRNEKIHQAAVYEALCSEEDYASRRKYPRPPLLRGGYEDFILRVMSYGITDPTDPEQFHVPVQFDPLGKYYALRNLYLLNAINEDGQITEDYGKTMAEYILRPETGRMVVEAEGKNYKKEVAAIATLLNEQNIFANPNDYDDPRRVMNIQDKFKTGTEDIHTLLEIWRGLQSNLTDNGIRLSQVAQMDDAEEARMNQVIQEWATANYLNTRTLQNAVQNYSQIMGRSSDQTVRTYNELSGTPYDMQGTARSVALGAMGMGNILTLTNAREGRYARPLYGQTDIRIDSRSVYRSNHQQFPELIVGLSFYRPRNDSSENPYDPRLTTTMCLRVEEEWISDRLRKVASIPRETRFELQEVQDRQSEFYHNVASVGIRAALSRQEPATLDPDTRIQLTEQNIQQLPILDSKITELMSDIERKDYYDKKGITGFDNKKTTWRTALRDDIKSLREYLKSPNGQLELAVIHELGINTDSLLQDEQAIDQELDVFFENYLSKKDRQKDLEVFKYRVLNGLYDLSPTAFPTSLKLVDRLAQSYGHNSAKLLLIDLETRYRIKKQPKVFIDQINRNDRLNQLTDEEDNLLRFINSMLMRLQGGGTRDEDDEELDEIEQPDQSEQQPPGP